MTDESRWKLWQLDKDKFSLQNSDWQAQLDEIKRQALIGLRITRQPEKVEALLSKILIYREGAAYPREDTERADCQVGTLAISLPSKHEGGDLIIWTQVVPG